MTAQLRPYGWPYAVLRIWPRARWMAIYDEICAGLVADGAMSRVMVSITLLKLWPSIVEQLRREARNAKRRARYAARKDGRYATP
jgi:hypothetical protein